MAYLYAVTLLTVLLVGLVQINIYIGMLIREKVRERKEEKKSRKEKKEKNYRVDITKKELDEYNAGRKERKDNG